MSFAITAIGVYGVLSASIIYLVMHGHQVWAALFFITMMQIRITKGK